MATKCNACESEFIVEVLTEGVDGVEVEYCPFCGELVEESHYDIDEDDDELEDDD
ncbi:MAG: hypothetical protein NTZ20_04840 [Candidatus Levybacteria bacterium]|nr:hypothetical protein [Candidatus Levybacteria bacterium]